MKKTKMLKKNYEFKKVLTRGAHYSGEFINAFAIKNYSKYNFLGLAISTKSGKAVKRNKIKRLIRESYRLDEKNMDVGYSIVFLWKKNKNIDDADFKKIKLDTEKILVKAGILKNEKNINKSN